MNEVVEYLESLSAEEFVLHCIAAIVVVALVFNIFGGD